MNVLHHALLGLAVACLGQASLRLASMLVASGLTRVVAGAVIGVSLAVVEALVLGLVGLGSNTAVLLAAAVLSAALVTLRTPRPEVLVRSELAAWCGGLGLWGKLAMAAGIGVAIAWVVWQLRHPSIGYDSSIYHYVEVAGWVHSGHPGAVLRLSYDIPYGNYPVTDEVFLTWAAGIARSFVPLVLWNPVVFVLLGAALWATLRNLAVPAWASGLATAAILLNPLVVHQLNEPQTDLPALTWVVCTMALVTAVPRAPRLLAPALLAAGLAVGTKTTAIVVVVAALAVGFVLARAGLRRQAGLLLVALAGAVAVGGVWYLRNLFDHGSPLWPFTAAPWGDPTPPFLKLVRTSLLERPGATLTGHLGTYAGDLAGGVTLLAGVGLALVRCLVPPALPRDVRRPLLIACFVTVVSGLAWAIAPGTGLPNAPGLLFPLSWPFSTIRYLLPALAVAAVAVALATRADRATRAGAGVVLVSSVVWSVVQSARLGYPYVPAWRTLGVGVVAGLVVGGVIVAALRVVAPSATKASLFDAFVTSTPSGRPGWLASQGGRAGRLARVGAAAGPIVVVAVAAALGLAANGLVVRHTRVFRSTALAQPLIAWLASQPGWDGGGRREAAPAVRSGPTVDERTPVAFIARTLSAPAAGDHFTHPLSLVPAHASCREVVAIARRSVVVVADPSFLRGLIGDSPYSTGSCLANRRPAYRDTIFKAYLPSG
ncbi:MAG: hypothetical protein ACJ76X_04515 [Solirubrobacteraceae bacterium]